MELFSFFGTTAKRFVDRGKNTFDIGLWNGKMGIAIYLLHLSRIMHNNEYEFQANDLIDAVFSDISNKVPVYFADGLLGIGCGVEYIIDKGFVEGDSDEILKEIDQMVKNIIDMRPTDLDSLDIDKGVCGVGCYLYYRLRKKSKNDESITTLKLKEYLIYLIDWMEELLLKTNKIKEYNDAYFLLCLFLDLDVLNHKVEKMIGFCLQNMNDEDYPLQDHYELLGIRSLKMLKPWILQTN
jgi:hypothetical protein